MALGKIAVKLTPKMTTINGTDHVFSFAISLVGNGAGTSAITTTDQDAIIEFFEEGDKNKVIAHIKSNIKLSAAKKIEFDLNVATFSRFVSPTDFTLDAKFNADSFKSSMDFTLKLPWEVRKVGKVEKLSVGAQLKIGSAQEVKAFSTATDKLDIPLKHEDVPDPDDVDAAGNPIIRTCFGVGVVYPEDNDLGVKVSQSGGVQVLLHSSLRTRCNALVASQYDLAAIQTHMNTIFKTAKLGTISVTQPTDASIDADWKLGNGRFFSKTVANPPTFFDGDGHLVPFFQYLFSGNGSSSGPGVVANAEALTEPKPDKVEAPTRKKRIVHAGVVFAGSFSDFATGFKLADTKDDKNKFLANVIAHEVGHAMGLAHGLEVVSGGYDLTNTVGLMTDLISSQTITLQAPGPVHAEVLEKLYP